MYRKISNRELAEKASTLAQLQAEAASLNDQIDAIKAEITGEMQRREAEEISVPGFLIRWTLYAASRFDGKAFKDDYPELAGKYTRTAVARRFSLAVN